MLSNLGDRILSITEKYYANQYILNLKIPQKFTPANTNVINVVRMKKIMLTLQHLKCENPPSEDGIVTGILKASEKIPTGKKVPQTRLPSNMCIH